MSTFALDHRDVLVQLSEAARIPTAEGLRNRDRLTAGMQDALQNGATFSELSAITGLAENDIQRRVNGRRMSDLELVAS